MAHKRIVLAWGILAALGMSACKTRLSDSEVVARINDGAVTKKDFQEQVERNMSRYRGQAQQLPPGIEVRIQESVLRRMIDDEIIAQKAKEQQLTITDAEVDEKFKQHKERFANDQAFADYLKRSNNTEAFLKEDLKRSLLRDRVVEKVTGPINVTDADVEKYYKENETRFREAEQIRPRRIVVKVPQGASDKEKAVKKKQAEKLHALAVKPGADFGKLAHEHSEGPEAPRDGDMGGFFARGHMPPDFDAAAFTLKPNEISKVSETKLGYEIVQVLERKAERQKPLDEVKESVRNALLARSRNDKRRDALRDLKNVAKVEILIKFDLPAGPVGNPNSGTVSAPMGGAPPPPPGGGVAPATVPNVGGVPPPAPGGQTPGPTPGGGAPPPAPPPHGGTPTPPGGAVGAPPPSH